MNENNSTTTQEQTELNTIEPIITETDHQDIVKGTGNQIDFSDLYNQTSDDNRFTKIKDEYKNIIQRHGNYKKICDNFENFKQECQSKGLNISKNDNGEIIATFKNIDSDTNKMIYKNNDLNCYFSKTTKTSVEQPNDNNEKKDIEQTNNNTNQEESKEEQEEEEEEKKSNAGIVVAVILILLAITIIGILTYLLLKKQNKSEQTNNTTKEQEQQKDQGQPTVKGTPTTEAKDETGQPVVSGNSSSTLNTSVNVSVPENSTMTQTEISILKEAANIEMNPNAITVVNGEQYSGFKVDNGIAYGWDAMGTKHNLGNYNNIEAYYGADRKPISNAVMTAMSKYHQVANGNGGLDYVKW